MKDIVVTEKEYDTLVKRMEFFDTMRNNLLTFSFTSVLTVLGIAIAMDMNRISVWICLMPFFLIIPFAARISYYRLATAHISSFLKEFAKENTRFEQGTDDVPEGECKRYRLIAWLVNHEMVLLGSATSCTFYIKYVINIGKLQVWDCVSLVTPVLLITIVYLITDATYDYTGLLSKFSSKWSGQEGNSSK